MEVPKAKVTKTTAKEAEGSFGFTFEQLRKKYGGKQVGVSLGLCWKNT